MIDLSSNPAIETAMFLEWIIPEFGSTHVSDYHTDVTINGDLYQNVGNLLSISGQTSELKASPAELSITLSGIPSAAVSIMLTKEIKGSALTLYRGLYDPTTHALLDLGVGVDNPVMKFKGIVTNYSINDDVDPFSGIASTTINITCNSIVEVLSKKINGRRTNEADFPDEDSMKQVQALTDANVNFGAP